MITSIKVDGFKTLSNFHLALNPGLNILVGPNGSGKTNIISFFEFLSHVVDANPSEATSHLGGAGAVFRRVENSNQPNITASITGCYDLEESRVLSRSGASKRRTEGFAVYRYDFTIILSNELESVVFGAQRLWYQHVEQFTAAHDIESLQTGWDLDVETELAQDFTVKTQVKKLRGVAVEYLPFFSTGKGVNRTTQAQEYLSRLNSASTAIPSLLMRFSPGLLPLTDDLAGGQTFNVIPSRVKVLEDSAKPPGIDSDGSGLSSTLYSLRKNRVHADTPLWAPYLAPGRGRMKRPSLETLKGYFRLANDTIEDIDVTNDPFSNQLRVTFKVKNGDYSAMVPLSLMSDGTLKWLTLLTASLTAPSVFSIEEPENYLHPTMQGQFVGIMREVLFSERKHVCTLMTTHSETLLNHCKPSELVIVSMQNGRTVSMRCKSEVELSDEIAKTGFGLGYYYIAGALQDE
jgi:ABC-type molybdenum transport system ATPase subunit/photorepair protein PhrA